MYLWSKPSKSLIGSEIDVEEFMSAGCEIVDWGIADRGTVLYVGTLEIFDNIFDGLVIGCVYVAIMWGLVRIFVEGGLFCKIFLVSLMFEMEEKNLRFWVGYCLL